MKTIASVRRSRWKRALGWSFVQACFLCWLIVTIPTFFLTKPFDRQLFSWLEAADDFFVRTDQAPLNPYVFINVANDQEAFTAKDGKRIVLTDATRLSTLLTALAGKRDSIRFIFCDLFLDEHDTLPLPLQNAVYKLKGKILFTTSSPEGANGKYPWLRRASSGFNFVDYLIEFPLLDKRQPTAPLQLYGSLQEGGQQLKTGSSWLPALFWLNDRLQFTNPIVNHHVRNEDLLGANKPARYPKLDLYMVLDSLREPNYFQRFGLSNKILVIADTDAASLEDKHKTTVQEDMFGVLSMLSVVEMLQRDETHPSSLWFLFIATAVFTASLTIIWGKGFGYEIAMKRHTAWKWIRFKKALTSRMRKTHLARLINPMMKVKNQPLKRVNSIKAKLDHQIVEVIMGAKLRAKLAEIGDDFLTLLLSWMTFLGGICVLSFLIFGIKFHFFLAGAILTIESGILSRILTLRRQRVIR